MPFAYYLEMPVEFPEGVHFGAGKDFNSLVIAQDGSGLPVLNGTCLAGVMRTLWRDYLVGRDFGFSGKTPREISKFRQESSITENVSLLFGKEQEKLKQEEETGVPIPLAEKESRVKVSNYELELGKHDPGERTHHHRNRHRGTVLEHGLFSLEACPPGTRTNVGFWVFDNGDTTTADIETFLGVIVAAFQQGISIGGNSNRGIGRAVTNVAHVKQRMFDLTVLDQQADQLDAHRNWRAGLPIDRLEAFNPNNLKPNQRKRLHVDVTLVIPRGQDILVGDGQAQDVQIEPQRVQATNGQYYWRIPGSSVRGLFRRWFHRLAVRDDFKVRDAADLYEIRMQAHEYDGDKLGWCFVDRENEDSLNSFEADDWPIVSLFGSCFNPGRITITDSLARCSRHDERMENCSECQRRVHVAVDRVTGGAAEGMLFDNRVVTAYADGSSPEFTFTITIDNPKQHEARWLGQTLVALDIGLLRMGSSKSAGRLSIKPGSLNADGEFKEEFLKQINGVTIHER